MNFQWVYAGDFIGTCLKSNYFNKIISISNIQVTWGVGQGYLVSSGSSSHGLTDNSIRKGMNIATLLFDQPKTGDVVQGLLKTVKIFETRKKSDTLVNQDGHLDTGNALTIS